MDLVRASITGASRMHPVLCLPTTMRSHAISLDDGKLPFKRHREERKVIDSAMRPTPTG